MAVANDAENIEKADVNQVKGRKFAAYHQAKERRQKFMDLMQANPTWTIAEICAHIEVDSSGRTMSRKAYEMWRVRYPEWGAEVDALRVKGLDGAQIANSWKGDFAGFRKRFFKMDSPWFHLEIISALETAPPGSITLILVPPGHGKTTVLEDWVNKTLAEDPGHRIGYASEKQAHSKKVLRRCKRRMTHEGGCSEYVKRFGPFEPEKGIRTSQPWGSEFFDVRRKVSEDERDYNFVALGVDGAVAGSRFDTVIVDDIQSRRTLNRTAAIIELMRQDFFTRAFGNDPMGRIIIIGTRVGEGDVYEKLMEEFDEETGEPLVTRVIKYPAIRYDLDRVETDEETGEPVLDKDGKTKPYPIYLWPERYNRAAYQKMRKMAGPLAWARNFQQEGFVAGTTTFDDEVLGHALNPLHSWEMPIPPDVKELAITVDPSIGGQNSICVQGWSPSRCILLDSQGDWGFTSIQQIAGAIRILIEHWNDRTREDGIAPKVRTLVVEHKAFQKAISHDPSILKLQTDYGLTLTEHETGDNKNDPAIGITGMVYSMYQAQIVFPAATDPITTQRIGPAVAEFRAWRPNKRGNKLKQDRVMAFWFGWLLWLDRRHTLIESSEQGGRSQFAGGGVPWGAMPKVALLAGKGSPMRATAPGPRRNRRV